MEIPASTNNISLPQSPAGFPLGKGILIGIVSFIAGGLVVSIALRTPFLNKYPGKSIVTTKETPTSTTLPVNRLSIGEFQPPAETTVSPKILAISKESKVAVFDPETEQLSLLSLQTSCCGGAMYIGDTGPLLSPTHQKIAYISKEDNNIWISDSDGNNKTKISTQGIAESELLWGTSLSLTGWSSDGKWLVYHVNIANEGMGINPEDKLNPSVIEGFYAADLKEGKTFFLTGLPTFVDFLPQSNLAVFIKEQRKEGQQNKADLYTYDLITGSIERLTKEGIKGTFVGQFSFSSDKKHFAYVNAESEPSSSILIYASLDNINKQELVKGGFTDIQFPKISPDGKLIAYEAYTPAACPEGGGGCPQVNLVIFNLGTNQKKSLTPIKKILYWFDNQRIVVIGGSYSGPWTLQLVDIISGSVKTIAQDETLRNQ